MGFLINALINLWRLLLNLYVRVLGRTPDFVTFDVSGSLPELETKVGFLRRRLRPAPTPLSLTEVRRRLARLVDDGRVRGVVLRIQNLDADWASLEELRREISDYRRRGGRVVAYLVEVDTSSYYLACAADGILVTPLATVAVTGLRTRVNFFKDALESVGVEAEVFAVSPYKSAYDTFGRSDFSEEAREQAGRLLDRRYAEVVQAIADGRKVTSEEARRKIDNAPYAADDALKKGLLDGVCYEDELPAKLEADDQKAKIAEWDVAQGSLKVPYRKRPKRRVGLVRLSGAIVRGKSRKLPIPLPLLGSEQAGSESVVAALRAAEKNRRVASVLFYVDSRGGDSLASDLIWREVERINEKKPVVVLMGNAAASGGYYVSASASHVVARSNTLTGSIGVISVRPVADDLYEKLRINPESLQRGARSNLFDLRVPPSDDERQVIRDQVEGIYAEFKDRVVQGRGFDPENLEELAGGRVWTGAEAQENGLVDEVGGWQTALNKAKELAGIEDEAPEVLVEVSPPRSGRPTPGEPAEAAREMIEDLGDTLDGLRSPTVLAHIPFTLTDD